MINIVEIVVKRFGTSSKHLLLNKIVFAISNRKTKTIDKNFFAIVISINKDEF